MKIKSNKGKIFLAAFLAVGLFIGGCDEAKKPVEQEKPGTKVEQPVEKKINVVVYRAAADGSEKLLPEKLVLKDNGKSPAEQALNALVTTKPQDAKMSDVVPIGVKVLGFKVDEKGTATVNFSKELATRGQGSYGEMMLVYSIVNTLTEYKEIKQVVFNVEGKPIITISGHMDLEDPIKRNKALLE